MQEETTTVGYLGVRTTRAKALGHTEGEGARKYNDGLHLLNSLAVISRSSVAVVVNART